MNHRLAAIVVNGLLVALAVALHNLPEGMAVGVVYAGSMQPEQLGSVSFASAFALAVGIALQNVPEGAIVAMPLRQAGMSRVKAFTLGMLSGAVEPLGALLTIGLGVYSAGALKQALIVPGSGLVKLQAEQEGLDRIFLDAGFEWREPGCSMCLGMNPDKMVARERSISTSNRNFEGRQGKGSRTHLASPAVAAATAIRGTISSPADL